MTNNQFIQTIKQSGFNLDSAKIDRLNQYLDEMLRWNKKVNLTSITDYSEAIEKHIVDSLYLLKYLNDGKSIVDMGSGAGLPGIPISICLSNVKVTSVDSVGKKINFQKHIKRLLKLDNFTALEARVEKLAQHLSDQKIEIVTARAFTSIGRLVEYASPLLNAGGILLAMKGGDGGQEVEENASLIEKFGFICTQVDSHKLPISLAERKIITFKKMID
jgi:16S rRNA (guanine527-N7)-methyltransferase